MARLFILTIFFVSTTSASSFGLRGGGSECVLRFTKMGKIIEKYLDLLPVNQEKLKTAISEANIVVKETEFIQIDGEEFYAINEPEIKKITLSQTWCKESLNLELEYPGIIVLHEYLGLSEPFIDKNYVYSKDLYKLTNLTPSEFYNLALTNGKDRNFMTTSRFANPKVMTPNELKLYNPLIPNQSANLKCEKNSGSYLFINTNVENHIVTNAYKVPSFQYCSQKIAEYITTFSKNSAMNFRIGFDSTEVYEINLLTSDHP